MKRVLLVLFVSALAAWATPNLISYQGKVEKDGSPYSGEATMEFALFETETGGAPFWSETQNVTVVDGIFNVLLGSVETLPALPLDECWLEVKVDGDVLPRQQITSVPYAEVAQQACANFQMVHDTAMDYTCPADGVLLIGWCPTTGRWSIKIDDYQTSMNLTQASIITKSVTAGTHHISVGTAWPEDFNPEKDYLWAIFMR